MGVFRRCKKCLIGSWFRGLSYALTSADWHSDQNAPLVTVEIMCFYVQGIFNFTLYTTFFHFDDVDNADGIH